VGGEVGAGVGVGQMMQVLQVGWPSQMEVQSSVHMRHLFVVVGKADYRWGGGANIDTRFLWARQWSKPAYHPVLRRWHRPGSTPLSESMCKYFVRTTCRARVIFAQETVL